MIRRICLTLLLLCSLMRALQAETHSAIKNYDRWQHMSMEQLEQLSQKYENKAPDSAFVVLSIMANRYKSEQLSHDDMVRCVVAMYYQGVMYMDNYHDYEKACSCLIQAIDFAESNHIDSEYIQLMRITLATISCIQHDIKMDFVFVPEDIQMFQKALKESRAIEHWDYMSICIINIVSRLVSHTSVGHELMVSDDLHVFLALPAPDTVAEVPFARAAAQGLLHIIDRNYDQALACFEQMRDIGMDKLYGNRGKITYLDIKGNTFIRAHRYREAIEQFELLLQTSQQNNMPEGLFASYFSLHNCYELLGDSIMAQHYRLLFLEQKDRMLNWYKLANINESQFLYQLDKANEQVLMLSQKQKTQFRLLLFLILSLLLLFTIIFLLMRNYRHTRHNNQLLYDKYQSLLAADEEKKQLIDKLMSTKPSSSLTKYQNSPMDESQKEDLLQRIIMILESNPEIYKESFSRQRLAELVDANPNYVSQVINEKCQCNFPSLLAEYRIKEACRRLQDTLNYGNLTMEAIATSLGFKSRSHFTTVFKRVTGITPTVYCKLSKKN